MDDFHLTEAPDHLWLVHTVFSKVGLVAIDTDGSIWVDGNWYWTELVPCSTIITVAP